MSTTPEFGTLEHFLEWVKTKDPKEKYEYVDCCECPVAQYMKAHYQDVDSIVLPFFKWDDPTIVKGVNEDYKTVCEVPKKLDVAANLCWTRTYGTLASYLETEIKRQGADT